MQVSDLRPIDFMSSGSVISIQNHSTCPTGALVIPPGVTAIANDGFADCAALTSVAIPSSVTSIAGGMFYGCLGLSAITVDASNPDYASAAGALLDKAQTTLVAPPCGAASYTVPSTVSSIGDNAFAGCAIANVTIPSSVKTIGVGAFDSCHALKSVMIPSSVTSIGYLAFGYCSLTSVTIPAGVTSMGLIPFNGCRDLTAISVDAANPSFSSSLGVLYDKTQTTLIEAPGSIASITIPASVTTIGGDAFDDCSALTAITIPATVTSIASRAFYCAGLTGVTMVSANPPSLGEGAFDCNPEPSYKIHVPSAAAVNAYGAAAVWQSYASRIVTP
jgi:hypothetical protein